METMPATSASVGASRQSNTGDAVIDDQAALSDSIVVAKHAL